MEQMHLEDVGQARPAVPESRAQSVRRHRIAQLCIDLADELVALAHELDPDLPDAAPPQQHRNGG